MHSYEFRKRDGKEPWQQCDKEQVIAMLETDYHNPEFVLNTFIDQGKTLRVGVHVVRKFDPTTLPPAPRPEIQIEADGDMLWVLPTNHKGT